MTLPDATRAPAATAAIGPSPPALTISVSDVLRIVKAAGGSLLVQAGLQLQLLAVEWARERRRLLGMLLAMLGGFACLLGLMFALSTLLLELSWNTPFRMPVLLGLTGLYGAGLVFTALRLRSLVNLGALSFAASRTELAADLALLREQL